jgi:hypothetical protein
MQAERFIKGLDGRSFGVLNNRSIEVYTDSAIDRPVQTLAWDPDERPSDIRIMTHYALGCARDCRLYTNGREPWLIPGANVTADYEYYDDFVLIKGEGSPQLVDIAQRTLVPVQSYAVHVPGYRFASRNRPGNQLILRSLLKPQTITVFQGAKAVLSLEIDTRIKGDYETAVFHDYLSMQPTLAGSDAWNEIHDLKAPATVIRWPVSMRRNNGWAYAPGSMGEGIDGLLVFEGGKILKLAYDKNVLRKRLCRFIRNDLEPNDSLRLCPQP